MSYADLVFEALCYCRNVGADPSGIRAYLSIREGKKHTRKEDRAVLRRLEAAGKVVRVDEKWFLTPAAYRQAKGCALAAEWESADSWILLALLYSRGRDVIRLEDIIGMADFIEHAIPTLEEMHGALNRLAAAGLIRSRGGFTVTPKAAALFAKVQATCSNRVRNQYDGLHGLLRCPCCGIRLKAVNWRIPIDRATYDTAYAAYYNAMRER
jgi:hypothetical protein